LKDDYLNKLCKNKKVTTTAKNRIKHFLLSFSVFLLLSFLFALQAVTINLHRGFPADFVENLKVNLIQWLPWSILALFALKIAKRFPLDLKKWYASIPLHVLFGLFFSVIQSFIYTIYSVILYGFTKMHPIKYFLASMTKITNFHLLTYAVIVVAGQMWAYYRKNKENELRTSQLQTQLVQAQLDVLRMQLNPHFLFNTLHTILAQVRKDPQAAESMISLLSDLFRKTLETSSLQEVPLKDELDLLKIFLEIQQNRFRDRLKVHMTIDPETLDIPVPNLILQPIVENAVRHGIATEPQEGAIIISAEKDNGALIIRVQDGGPGFSRNREDLFDSGFGLRNCRDRLDRLYGKDYRLTLDNVPQGGALVLLKIPLRKHPGESIG
jgi:two-component system LytT family sensor kinase